jgi:hypothetical protein
VQTTLFCCVGSQLTPNNISRQIGDFVSRNSLNHELAGDVPLIS